MRFSRALAMIATLFGLLVGCSAKRLPDYSLLSIHQYMHKSTQHGLTVAIHPMTHQTEIEEYFGTNLLAHNVLPVLVVAENRSAELSFIIRKEEMKLSLENAQSFETGRSKAVGSSNAAEAVLLASTVLVSPVLLFVGIGMESHAAEIRRNFAMKEFQHAMVSPGDVKSGFIYFQLPEPADSFDRWLLQIQAMDPRNKTTLTYSYVFDWKRRP